MAIKVRSRKNKGKGLQNQVRLDIINAVGIDENDIKCRISGPASGRVGEILWQHIP